MYVIPFALFSNYFLFTGCGISLQKQIAQRRIVGGDDAGFGNFLGYLIFYAAVISCNKNIIEFQATFLGKHTYELDHQGMKRIVTRHTLCFLFL